MQAKRQGSIDLGQGKETGALGSRYEPASQIARRYTFPRRLRVIEKFGVSTPDDLTHVPPGLHRTFNLSEKAP